MNAERKNISFEAACRKSYPSRIILGLAVMLAVISIFNKSAYAFDPPSCGDPWYYQSDTKPTFWIPDKAQHYWGSYSLSQVTGHYLGKIPGAMLSFYLGFLWEVKDSQEPLRNPGKGVVGFSCRDLIADGLGVLSSSLTSDNMLLYMNYSTSHREITLNVTWRL